MFSPGFCSNVNISNNVHVRVAVNHFWGEKIFESAIYCTYSDGWVCTCAFFRVCALLSSLKFFVTNLIFAGIDPVRPLSLLETLIKFYWFYIQDAAHNTTDLFFRC